MEHKVEGYCAIGLDNPKNGINVGQALRAAANYGAAFVAASGKRCKPGETDASLAYRNLPFLRPKDLFDLLPYDCVPVAVDLIPGAKSLIEYVHPERAFYIFGSEDATLGKRILDKCRDVIYIPTIGSMNLAAAVNVVLYDRLAKYSKHRDFSRSSS